eukprot:4152064-Lingulodinium_polyedra.AAC.1
MPSGPRCAGANAAPGSLWRGLRAHGSRCGTAAKELGRAPAARHALGTARAELQPQLASAARAPA